MSSTVVLGLAGAECDHASCHLRPLAQRPPEGTRMVATDASYESLWRAIRESSPAYVWVVGHGTPEMQRSRCRDRPWIDVRTLQSEEVASLLRGRIVHLLACHAGRRLVEELVRRGVRTAIGYSDAFYFGVKMHPLIEVLPCSPPADGADYYTRTDCDAEIVRSLLRGASVREALRVFHAKTAEYVDKYTFGEWKDYAQAKAVVIQLMHNARALRAEGDLDVRLADVQRELTGLTQHPSPSPSPTPSPLPSPPPAPALARADGAKLTTGLAMLVLSLLLLLARR